MALFEWKNDYSVGVGAMDIQHQQLFAMINQLHEALRIHKTDSAMHTILPALYHYARTHFVAEEKLMREVKYPTLATHLGGHRQFTMKIDAAIEKYKSSGAAPTVTLAVFLKDWLSSHILTADKQYSQFAAEKKQVCAAV